MNLIFEFKGWWKRTFKKRYKGTPEMFLAEMLFLEKMLKKQYPHPTADDLAGLCFKVLRIDISPYKSFKELKDNAKPNNIIIDQLKQNARLYTLLVGKGIQAVSEVEEELLNQLAYHLVNIELHRP